MDSHGNSLKGIPAKYIEEHSKEVSKILVKITGNWIPVGVEVSLLYHCSRRVFPHAISTCFQVGLALLKGINMAYDVATLPLYTALQAPWKHWQDSRRVSSPRASAHFFHISH